MVDMIFFDNDKFPTLLLMSFEKSIIRSKNLGNSLTQCRRICDALLGPRVNPLEVHQCEVAESWDRKARSRLPTLKRGRGSSWEPRD